jgi:hypothetical protein
VPVHPSSPFRLRQSCPGAHRTSFSRSNLPRNRHRNDSVTPRRPLAAQQSHERSKSALDRFLGFSWPLLRPLLGRSSYSAIRPRRVNERRMDMKAQIIEFAPVARCNRRFRCPPARRVAVAAAGLLVLAVAAILVWVLPWTFGLVLAVGAALAWCAWLDRDATQPGDDWPVQATVVFDLRGRPEAKARLIDQRDDDVGTSRSPLASRIHYRSPRMASGLPKPERRQVPRRST